MTAQHSHISQIFFHIAAFTEQLITEQAVHRKYCRTFREFLADGLYGIPCNRPVITQLQQYQNVRIVYLPETCQCIARNLFNGNDADVVAVDFAKRILECPCQNLLVRYFQNALIYLFCGSAVQGTDDVFFSVRIGRNETIIFIRMVYVFFVCLNAPS